MPTVAPVARRCDECESLLEAGSAQALNTPLLSAAGAVLRRRVPSHWPANGLAANFAEYRVVYDILLLRHPQLEGTWELPLTGVPIGTEPNIAALNGFEHINGKRAEFVDAVTEEGSPACTLLHVIPVDRDGESGDRSGVNVDLWPEARWFQLREVYRSLHSVRNPPLQFSSLSRLLLASLDKWLYDFSQLPTSVMTVWRPAAYFRTRRVIANPINAQHLEPSDSADTNTVIRNPLFESGLVMPPPGTTFDNVVEYEDDFETHDFQMSEESALKRRQEQEQAKLFISETTRKKLASQPVSETMSWADRFPVHRAACEGNADAVRNLIEEGFGAADVDDDSWTPMHYASWNGKTAVVRVLMSDWQGAPAEKTDSGSTALHFAARNGFPEIVRILLACPIVDLKSKDDDGETPLSLCERFKLNEWKEVSKILRDPEAGLHAVNRFQRGATTGADAAGEIIEHRISLMDGSNKVLRLPGGVNTTANDLRDAVAGLVRIPDDAFHLFAIWMQTPSLGIQLQPDWKPLKRLKRWPQIAELYVEPSVIEEEHPRLFFKRNEMAALSDERKTRSQVAVKFLYDEALQNFLNSTWPTSLADSVYLAGMLMQIRFGDHNPQKHVPGFLSDALETFVPQHLLHNQLKTSEWERRIFEMHRQHEGKTDILLLHRLFLQFCWQWPYYGATFFDGELTKVIQRMLRASRNEPVRIAVNSDWLCIVYTEKNEFKYVAMSIEEITSTLMDNGVLLQIHYHGADSSKLAGLSHHMKGQPSDLVHIVSRKAPLIHALIESMQVRIKNLEKQMQKTRLAQGGPRVMQLASEGEHASAALSREELEQYLERQNRENMRRFELVRSFGQLSDSKKCAAEAVFALKASNGTGDSETPLVHLKDLKNVCYELGYWLGSEAEGARVALDSTGAGLFSFRDLISWWMQSNRSWLFLVDDNAFKERQKATEIFLRNDPGRTGKVHDEKLNGLVRGLKASHLTKKTERAIREGLDPSETGVLYFNSYIDWLCRMGIIADRLPSQVGAK